MIFLKNFFPLGNTLCSNIPRKPKVFRQLQWSFRAGFSCKLSWEKESGMWLSMYSKLLLPAGVGEKKNQVETCQLFIFLTQTEGFKAITERYHFEKLFFPDLWHLLCFTQPQNTAGRRAGEGCVWSPAQRRRLGSRSRARWKQRPTVAAAPGSAWGPRAALEKALSSQAAFKHFKYRCEVVCVPRAAPLPLIWEPPLWLGEAGLTSSVPLSTRQQRWPYLVVSHSMFSRCKNFPGAWWEVGKSQVGWRRDNPGLFLNFCSWKTIKAISGMGLF